MNPIIKQSLSLYRRIIRNANLIVQLNSGTSFTSSQNFDDNPHSMNRSRKVIELIPDEEMRHYIIDHARKHFRLTQRQFYQGKLTDGDEILRRLNTAKWANFGLECAIRDMTRETHKRKHIKQSPTVNILQVAVEGYGNNQVHDELLDALIVAAKFDQFHRGPPPSPPSPVSMSMSMTRRSTSPGDDEVVNVEMLDNRRIEQNLLLLLL